VYVAAAWLPATSPAFADDRYRTDWGAALRTALVVIPLGTVLSFFALMVTAWVTFLGVKVALKWFRVL